jgi:hypothetical protein
MEGAYETHQYLDSDSMRVFGIGCVGATKEGR